MGRLVAVFAAVAVFAIVGVCGLFVGLGCEYDAPPDVVEFACLDNSCVVSEPIVLRFTEAVRPESVSVVVWPGERTKYDLEGRPLPGLEPVLPACTVASSPCGEGDGITLSLDADREVLSIDVANGALGPLYRPLVLEVGGSLEDDAGRRLNVSRMFDFQMIAERWNPSADTAGGGGDTAGTDGDATDEDVAPPEPLGVTEGRFLFHAELATPLGIDLAQQFFADLQVNQLTGEWYGLMTDGDPIGEAPRNTSNPDELFMDVGTEGFVFTVYGQISQDENGLVFEGEPFTLELKILSIRFALRNAEMRGSISIDPDTGRARWDGTLAVGEVMIDNGSGEQLYPPQQDNFQMFELTPEQVPDGQPTVCLDDPCTMLSGGQCDVPVADGWPPASVCPDTDSP